MGDERVCFLPSLKETSARLKVGIKTKEDNMEEFYLLVFTQWLAPFVFVVVVYFVFVSLFVWGFWFSIFCCCLVLFAFLLLFCFILWLFNKKQGHRLTLTTVGMNPFT